MPACYGCPLRLVPEHIYENSFALWAAFGASFITVPITSGALSKRLDSKEQGIGLGVIHAMKGITWSTAPYIFSGLFAYFKNDGYLITMPFMVTIGFIVCGFPIVCGPLRTYINNYDENKLKCGIAPIAGGNASLTDSLNQEEQDENVQQP